VRFHQAIHWVALPAGVESGEGSAGELRLSVFIAPQLGVLPDTTDAEPIVLPLPEWPDDARPTLANYPVFENWAAEAARVEFSVEVQDRPAVGARRVSDPPSPELWAQLFGPETRVQPFVMDRPHIATVNTFAVDAIMDSLETGYSEATLYEPPDFDIDLPLEIPVEDTQPVDPGSGGGGDGEPIIMSLFPDVVEMTTTEEFDFLVNADQQVFVEGLNTRLAFAAEATTGETQDTDRAEAVPLVERVPPMLLAPSGTRAGEWGRLMAFRRVGETFHTPDLDFDEEPIPTLQEQRRAEEQERLHRSFDLHKMLAALGDHSALLRPLGLVIDLLVPADVVTGATNPRICVRPQWTAGSTVFDLAEGEHEDLSPWTEFVHDP
jgi:hypothetical protein